LMRTPSENSVNEFSWRDHRILQEKVDKQDKILIDLTPKIPCVFDQTLQFLT
jgi:hypothetical protein